MFDISRFDKNKITKNDENILKDIKTWNNQLFEMIYDKWNKKIFSYLMTILNYNKEDANQILSDVFMALYEFNKINEVTNCKQFLYTTAHNKAVDWIKKKSEDYNQEMLKDNAIDNKDIENKNNLNLTFKQKLMQKYLNMLNSEEKDVVHLYYYEDKSYEEIAQIIGSNKNTVWTLLSQAKKKLQEFVNREWTRDILEN